jgi:hypothetical protein
VSLPAWRGRRQSLVALVEVALGPLRERWGQELDGLQVVVEDVPPDLTEARGVVSDGTVGGEVPLARAVEGRPPRVVVYRKPLELRADDPLELEELVHDVVVEAVAELLGLRPDEVDPDGQG